MPKASPLAFALRTKGFDLLSKVGGSVGTRLRAANDFLGQPLASAAQIQEQAEFARPNGSQAHNTARAPQAAPTVIYYMDQHRRDLDGIESVLTDAKVPYVLRSLENDEAGQAAVKRDAGHHRLPCVFIAGEPIGGKVELLNAIADGSLAKKVWGR